MQKKLRICFERGISATVASKEVGINIKTVCKYYEEWVQQINESETADLMERQKNERQRAILSFDYDIIEAYKQSDYISSELNKLREENKPIPRYLFSFKLEIMRFISNLKERKGAISMVLDSESSIDKKIQERLQKHVEDSKRDK